MKFLRELKDLSGKTVLLRTDLDAPHDGNKIMNDYRIQRSLETIKFLQEHGAKIIAISKLGRPKKSDNWEGRDQSESLRPVAEHLANLLGKKPLAVSNKIPKYDVGHLILFTGDIRLKENLQVVKEAPQKDLILLENIRFYPEEETLDQNFAKLLASMADIYVEDAFAVVHRTETSVSELPKFLPAYAGLNLEREIKSLDKAMELKASPFVLMMAGIKISDKVGAIRNLGKDANHILLGGGLANLFLKSKGYEIGCSKVETDKQSLAEELLRNYKDKIILPIDVVVGSEDYTNPRVVMIEQVKKDDLILDIGPKTILEFSKYIKNAKKMVWNGPMGLFEKKPFSQGTMSLALLFASKCDENCFGVAGGGDTLEAIAAAKIGEHISFISTGGGAMLEYLAGEKLPGITALN